MRGVRPAEVVDLFRERAGFADPDEIAYELWSEKWEVEELLDELENEGLVFREFSGYWRLRESVLRPDLLSYLPRAEAVLRAQGFASLQELATVLAVPEADVRAVMWAIEELGIAERHPCAGWVVGRRAYADFRKGDIPRQALEGGAK